MPNLYSSRCNYYAKFFITAALLLSFYTAYSQESCATLTNCTPGIASSGMFSLNMGIYRVRLHTLDNMSAGASEGYRNFYCTERTTLQAGANYTIDIQTGVTQDENVRVWIDFNNNQTFEASELVLSSNSNKQHAATFTVPASAVTGQYVRMRVSSDYFASALPTPCSTPEYSQVEDYGVQFSNEQRAPEAQFRALETASCTGRIQFRDESLYVPDTWLWNFGDGNTSTQQHPLHAYQTPGIYTISLTVSNAAGSNQLTREQYINYHNQAPKPMSCRPATNDYCCGYGITRVALGSLLHSSANASAGYEDFTCSLPPTELYGGDTYSLSLQTGSTNPHDTKVWIDYNDDGIFHETQELAGSAINSLNPNILIFISTTAVLNTPLRMRISTDYAGSTFNACSNLRHGQAEDYTLIIKENTEPPVAAFSIQAPPGCGRSYSFQDSSQNVVTTYLWNFGDGTVSSDKNPSHTYTSTGRFEVSLTVSNSHGENTFTQEIAVNDGPVAPVCRPSSSESFSDIGVKRVIFGTIDNSTPTGDGYQDYACSQQTILQPGQTHLLQVYTSQNFTENARAWIDYNNDGAFSENELVMASQGRTFLEPHQAKINIPSNAVLNTPLRLRIMSDEANRAIPQACTNVQFGQCEDYTIWIDSPLSSAKAGIDAKLQVYPNPSSGRVHLKSASLSFATIEVRNILGNLVHTYTKPQGQPLDYECNLSNIPKGIYLVTIRSAESSSTQKLIIE
jgi:PKD repeat protein